jgi:hypothetical protein
MNILVDIDGTICEDIPNEESERYPSAVPFKGAAENLQILAQTNTICYFTAREEKDRQVTLDWLNKHGFPIHGLIMGKPRSDGQGYVWIDNHKVDGMRFQGDIWPDGLISSSCVSLDSPCECHHAGNDPSSELGDFPVDNHSSVTL